MAGGPAGDLIVTVHVAAHPWFKRDGQNLLVEVPVTPSEAALGAKIDVPTLNDGMVVLTIPPGTSSGAKLRLRGKGVLNHKSGERGDQFVTLKIAVPKDLTPEARSCSNDLPCWLLRVLAADFGTEFPARSHTSVATGFIPVEIRLLHYSCLRL